MRADGGKWEGIGAGVCELLKRVERGTQDEGQSVPAAQQHLMGSSQWQTRCHSLGTWGLGSSGC